MSKRAFEVEVTQTIRVELDEEKFDEEFMDEFKMGFYDFPFIEDHVEHLAQLCARGLIGDFTTFIEGYGPPEEMGIKVVCEDCDVEVLGELCNVFAEEWEE